MTVEKACKKLIITEPFWGLFLLGLNKVVTDKIDTMAVAPNGIGVELWVNEEFWNSLTDPQQMAVLLHELHHLSFNHILMGQDFENRKKFNIACDAEVNCYINNLPDGHIDCRNFGLEQNQGTKYYYKMMPDIEDEEFDDHSMWKKFDQMSNAEKELVKQHVDGMLKQAAEQTIKQRGTIPAQIQGIIDELLKERPRIYDWKSKLRRVLGTEIELSFRKTHQRPSKRFPGSPGIKFKRKAKVLVGIDTSGSVSNEELSEFFSEINHIHKAGVQVHIVEFDADISSEWDFKALKNIQITGRGGTDFTPMVEYYMKHKKEYTLFVIFSDGYAPVDHLFKYPLQDMMWIITSSGEKKKYPGKVLYIPKSQEA